MPAEPFALPENIALAAEIADEINELLSGRPSTACVIAIGMIIAERSASAASYDLPGLLELIGDIAHEQDKHQRREGAAQ